jgi:hypothetical protein
MMAPLATLVMGSVDRDQSGLLVVHELGEGWRRDPVMVGEVLVMAREPWWVIGTDQMEDGQEQ